MASAGLPGLNNFTGEFLILVGSFRVAPLPAVLAIIGIILPLVYTVRLVQEVLFVTERQRLRPVRPFPAAKEGCWRVLAIVAIYLGVHPAPLLEPS